jgi:hypothetical protein
MSLDTHICELKLILVTYAKIQVCPAAVHFIKGTGKKIFVGAG